MATGDLCPVIINVGCITFAVLLISTDVTIFSVYSVKMCERNNECKYRCKIKLCQYQIWTEDIFLYKNQKVNVSITVVVDMEEYRLLITT